MSEVFSLYFLCKGFFCAYTRVERTSGESLKREQGERRVRKFLDKYYFGCTLTNSILTKGYLLINSDDVL